MDSIFQAKCANIYDIAITSHLGTEIIKFFASEELQNPELTNQLSFILQIRDKLDESKYKTPEEFIDEVKTIYELKARDLGADSDISLSILTILQLMVDKYDQSFPSIHVNSPKFSEFTQFMEEFEEFALTAPNDRDSFISIYNSNTHKGDAKPRSTNLEKIDDLGEKADLDQLYKNLLTLKTDKDIEKVVDIIISHEPSYSHSENIVEIDLNRCQPYTLRLIQNYLNHKEKNEEYS